MQLSSLVAQIQPSITMAISSKAKALKAQGVDVIAMSAGEPDFPTPEHICDAAVKAIKEGFTNYTPATGIPVLKEAVAEKFKNDNGLDYSPAQVMVSNGAKHSVFLTIFALSGPGSEVIIPTPYWVSYPSMAEIAGAKPVIVQTSPDNNLKITPEQLSDAITPKTTLLVLNTPSNPSGMVYTEDELRALAEVIVEKDIMVVSDEIYEKLLYEGAKNVSIGSFNDEIFKRTVTINGVSKAYAMTGWRIGFAGGPEEVIKKMGAMQSQETSNPNSIAQKAALAAITGPQEYLEDRRSAFDGRRRFIVERLNGIDGVSCIAPKGAFYVFPDVSPLYGKSHNGNTINGSLDFCNYMLDEQKIALVPGVGFGADNHVRISYAMALEQIEEALKRFEAGVKALS